MEFITELYGKSLKEKTYGERNTVLTSREFKEISKSFLCKLILNPMKCHSKLETKFVEKLDELILAIVWKSNEPSVIKKMTPKAGWCPSSEGKGFILPDSKCETGAETDRWTRGAQRGAWKPLAESSKELRVGGEGGPGQ